MKGAYIFVLTLDTPVELNLGRNRWKLNPGTYDYIGSGMGNLEKRVERHFLVNKRLRWHIDYLTCHGKPLFAILITSKERMEEKISLTFQSHFRCVEGFGASDLKVLSNLYIIDDFQKFSEVVIHFLAKEGEKL
ncbi:GIY-YIG nuclease family protein [Fervidobacterium sp.]